MEAHTHNFVHYLQNELLIRCRKNNNYSMRAYAKSLGVNQSLLSKILRGKKPISKKMILELSSVLKLSKIELDSFFKSSNSHAVGFQNAQKLRDQFELLSDWYHFAILELTHLKSFKSNPKWIAATLGITVSEVNIAIDRLVRNELIKIHTNGKWQVLKPHNNWTDPAVTQSARKIYQKNILERAVSAIQEIDFDYRHNTSMTLSVNVSLLPKIKKMLNQYRDEITQYAETRADYTDVYQLAMAFYPLTYLENKKSKRSNS